MKRLFIAAFLLVQQPDDNAIIAGLVRQVSALQVQLQQLRDENAKLKMKCGDPCKEP